MSLTTEWLNPPHILAKHFEGYVTGRDLDQVIHEVMQEVGDKELYVLMNFHESELLPEKIFELPSLSQLLSHSNLRWLALISPEDYDARTTRLLAQGKIKVFNQLPMGIAFLRGMVRVDLGIVLPESNDASE